MKLIIVLLLTCSVSISFCAIATEYAPVTDPDLIKEGYSCQSKTDGLGLMKNGQVIKNYEPNGCGQAECANGIVDYTSCIPAIESTDCKAVSDSSKPFPECCPRLVCNLHM